MRYYYTIGKVANVFAHTCKHVNFTMILIHTCTMHPSYSYSASIIYTQTILLESSYREYHLF